MPALWGYRAYLTGDTSLTWGNWFGLPPEPRLSVSEQATVDGRRKLLLIRRDDVEHLIMTGGPVDVVIETNIAVPSTGSGARAGRRRAGRAQHSRVHPSTTHFWTSRQRMIVPRNRRFPPFLLVALLLAAAALAYVCPATAQTQPTAPADQQNQGQAQSSPGVLTEEIKKPIAKLTTAIETAEKALQQLSELEDELGRLRLDVEEILGEFVETAENLRPQLAAVRSQIEKLGPVPGKDAPPEGPAIAADRARLTALATEFDGAIKAAELTWVRARQLIERITVLRHSLFTRNLLERLPSPLLPGVWHDFSNETPAVGRRLHYLFDDWSYWASHKTTELIALVLAAIVLFFVLRVLVARYTGYRHVAREVPPTFFERAFSVSWTAPLRALPVAAAALLLYVGLDALDLLYAPWGRVAAAVLKAILVLAAVTTVISMVLTPSEPNWRFVQLSDRAARRIVWLLYGITGVYAIDVALTEISRVFFVPLPVSVVQSFIASTLFATLLIGLLLTPFEPRPRHSPRWLKAPLWLIAPAFWRRRCSATSRSGASSPSSW